jgi:formylglycine-generating enzyme required for sulfatase activity/tetratricopeptide (TPR) repeat protein
MPLNKKLIGKAFGAILGNPVVAALAEDGLDKAVSILKQHFTFSGFEIGRAFQESYEEALNSISTGLKADSILASAVHYVSDSKLSREFSIQVKSHYLKSFAAKRNISDLDQLRKQMLNDIKILYKPVFQDDNKNPFSESELTALVGDQGSDGITGLILEQVGSLDETLAAFLAHDELLGNAVLFFFREKIREDKRVEASLAALQREGLLAEVSNIDTKFNMLFEELLKIQRQFDLSNQVKASDALTRHNSRSMELIQAAVTKLKALPSNKPKYHELIIMAGTVLSSTGNTSEAEKLFVQARDLSQNDDEKALASYNLFQIHLWNNNYEQALADLQVAIDIDDSRYALHDVDRYPIIKLLGAGGMGCVFLCHDQWRENQLVVKCFWEGRKGSREEVFGEAMNMRQIASEYVPKPLDCGYADSKTQEHPYFVTEYIEDTLDGEDWLKERGKLDVATGINVGLQIAKGLQVAHSKDIYHLDLKPANLLFKQTDTGLMVKIIDFGLSGVASSLREEVSARNSGGKTVLEQNIVAGTHDYGAPEQLGDNKYGTISAKTDLFAFGATLYRLMTAKSPRHLNPRHLKDAPPDLLDLLFDCKEEDPNERPEIADVIARLESLLVVEEKEELVVVEEEKEELVVEEEKPQLKPGDIFRDSLKDNSEGPEMVLIPAGTFRMGDITGNGRDNEQPVHEVSVESFAMGRYPVTFAEYDYFCEATNREKPDDAGWGRDNRPVINVSWHDAVAYTEWLSEQTGQEYRLPTEAEWEYAARAGTETDYWWGDDIDQTKANYNSNIGHTTPVGDYEANTFGLYDTAGNVWEWTCSEYEDTYNGKEKDCITKNSNENRVLRGGSWENCPGYLRTAFRFGHGPVGRSDYCGFRLVRAAWT